MERYDYTKYDKAKLEEEQERQKAIRKLLRWAKLKKFLLNI